MSYRIHSVLLEGFKGFGPEYEIVLDGKSLFVFGPNGYGKTSLLEGIRWCLYGSSGSWQNEVVRNRHYASGECSVELRLSGPDGLSRIVRRQPIGSTRSDVTAYASDGRELNITELLPPLSSHGSMPGTYVIYGGPSQQPPPWRALESTDIADFGPAIYGHWGLTEIPRLVSVLGETMKDHHVEEDELAPQVETLKSEIQQDVERLEEDVDKILTLRPWPEQDPPTREASEARLTKMAREIAGRYGVAAAEQVGAKDSLVRLRDLLYQHQPTEDALQHRLDECSATREKLLEIHKKLAQVEHKIPELEEQLGTLRKRAEQLGPAEAIRAELEAAKRELEQKDRRGRLASAAAAFLEHERPTQCPVCSGDLDLASALDSLRGEASTARISEQTDAGLLHALEESLAERERLDVSLGRVGEEIAGERQKRAVIAAEAGAIPEVAVLPGVFGPKVLDEAIEAVESRIRELRASLGDLSKAVQLDRERTDHGLDELRYHDLRDQLDTLRVLQREDLARLEEQLVSFSELGPALDGVRVALSNVLRTAMREPDRLPALCKRLTEVYQHLTHQKAFDQILVDVPDGANIEEPKLPVKVMSSRKPDLPAEEARKVLNAQAVNALRLVPYFVFSEYQAGAVLDFLLLDDPTQSFDGTRVEDLLRELANVANHAQIVLVTHEEDRFRPGIAGFFPEGSYRCARVKDFEPGSGPKFEFD